MNPLAHIHTVKRFVRHSSFLPFLIMFCIIGILSFILLKNTFTSSNNPSSDTRVTVKEAVAVQKVNKSFSFPLKDESETEVSKFTYTVETVELRDEIIVKGQKASAVKGKRFLIANLKITNNYEKTISIAARDYIRFVSGDSKEKLAPDIHNDPVEVQAISTKSTRVGVAVDDTEKKFTLQIGEINGKKETVSLTFK